MTFVIAIPFQTCLIRRDDVGSSLDTHQDDAINTSTSTTPGRPHTGTSLDSSPATTDDESFRDIEGWNAATTEIIQQLTETEKKRQEIIKGLTNAVCSGCSSF